MLYTGVPKPRRKGVPGANKVACAMCGIPGTSVDMVFLHVDAPGYPHTRALVHPECKDIKNPGARPVKIRAEKPAYTTQPAGISLATVTDSITLTAATFAATGTTTATVAQATADPTIALAGTGFTTRSYGYVDFDGVAPQIRATTYYAAISLGMELNPTFDVYARSLVVGVMKHNHGTQISTGITLTIT